MSRDSESSPRKALNFGFRMRGGGSNFLECERG